MRIVLSRPGRASATFAIVLHVATCARARSHDERSFEALQLLGAIAAALYWARPGQVAADVDLANLNPVR